MNVKNNMKTAIAVMAVVSASLLGSAPSVFANAVIWIDGTESSISTATAGSMAFSADGITASMQWNTGGPIFIDLGVASSLSAGTMIVVSDNYNPGAGSSSAVEINSSILLGGSDLVGSINSYWDPGNGLGVRTDELTSLAIPSGFDATTMSANFGPGSSDYSLTEVLDIVSGSGPISADFSLTVPDSGTSMTLLGIGLAGLAAIRSRIPRKA
jgi:hypothetical protein